MYNNKGGVGKTTLSLFLADFLSSMSINKKKSRVLVIDFDPQASCSNAILGLEKVTSLRNKGLTLPHALQERIKGNEACLDHYIHTRHETDVIKTRKIRLGNLDVIISESDLALNFDENASLNDSLLQSNWIRSHLSKKYDFIFIDLPGNLSKRNGYSLIGAFLVDYFIIPTEPNRLNINSIPSTLKMLSNIKEWKGKGAYKLLGFVLNKADKRTKQYKLHKDELMQFANIADCKIYNSILPPTPKLSNASDDSIVCHTLFDRYDTYYQHVRSLVLEVVKDLGFSANVKKPNTKK